MEYMWTNDQPIYKQVMDEIITWIISGKLNDGDALPSIRKLAAQFQVNPLTASKACQELNNIDIVDTQRGIGLYVRKGARKFLLKREKEKFLKEELPALAKRMALLDINRDELLAALYK